MREAGGHWFRQAACTGRQVPSSGRCRHVKLSVSNCLGQCLYEYMYVHSSIKSVYVYTDLCTYDASSQCHAQAVHRWLPVMIICLTYYLNIYELFQKVQAFLLQMHMYISSREEHVMSTCARLWATQRQHWNRHVFKATSIPTKSEKSDKPSAKAYMNSFAGSLGVPSCPAHLSKKSDHCY